MLSEKVEALPYQMVTHPEQGQGGVADQR